ncbi:MAG: glycosyltransferase family 25 protein [Pseudomonadota bacterium]
MLKIRVISMDSADRRRSMMSEQLSQQSTPWSIMDACTSEGRIPYRDDLAMSVLGRSLNRGEIGCFTSHAQLWSELAAEPDGSAYCILEDDVLLDGDFFNRLSDLAALIQTLGYIRLYAKVPAPPHYVTPLVDMRHVVRFHRLVFGTQGYLLSKRAALTLLTHTSCFYRPVDHIIDRFWDHGLPIYCIYPFPLIELNFGTTIERSRRVDVQPDLGRKIRKAVDRTRRHLKSAQLQLKGPPKHAKDWVKAPLSEALLK